MFRPPPPVPSGPAREGRDRIWRADLRGCARGRADRHRRQRPARPRRPATPSDRPTQRLRTARTDPADLRRTDECRLRANFSAARPGNTEVWARRREVSAFDRGFRRGRSLSWSAVPDAGHGRRTHGGPSSRDTGTGREPRPARCQQQTVIENCRTTAGCASAAPPRGQHGPGLWACRP